MTDNQLPEGTDDQGQSAGDTTTVEELKAELEKKEAEIESIKNAQSGSDRANTELQKQLTDLQNSLKEKMSEADKKAYEDAQLKKQLAELLEKDKARDAKERANELRDLKLKVLKDNELNDIDMVELISGDTIETFIKNVALYKEKESKILSKKFSGSEPKKGQAADPNNEISRSDFDKLDPIKQMKIIKEGKKIV